MLSSHSNEQVPATLHTAEISASHVYRKSALNAHAICIMLVLALASDPGLRIIVIEKYNTKNVPNLSFCMLGKEGR